MRVEKKGFWVIVLTFAIALFLTILPLPEWVSPWRPDWLLLVTVYWCMALPDRIGILPAWICGLFLDVSQGAILGMNAMGLTVLATLIISNSQLMRIMPLAQQAVTLCIYLIAYELFIWLMCLLFELPVNGWTHWVSAVVSAALWPWVFVILRDLRRRYVH
ncbi:MAG: rod shape-determining protein MreD [Candidatus Eutrophobiaceae bacterium]